MHFIWTIIIGFLAGLLARALTPGSQPAGFILTTALGIGGSILATYVGQSIGLYQAGQLGGFIAAVVGAVVLLLVYGMLRKKA